MVETIAPVVYGNRTKYLAAIGLHTLGATASAGLLGAALGGIGSLAGAPWGALGPTLVAVVALLYALRETLGLPVPLIQLERQVPQWWRTFFEPRAAATLYGLALGIGFGTYLSFGTFVAVAAGALAFGDPLLGAQIVAPFGAARGLSLLVGWSAHDPEEVGERVERLGTWRSGLAPAAVNAGSCAAVALAASVSIL